LACLSRALDEFVIEGIHKTIPIHREIKRLPDFRDGHVDTTFIERTWRIVPGILYR
jgi:acetyl-CoA carboxylase, biotin carboxylase subunit